MRVGKKKKTTPNLGSVHECNYELSIYILRAYATVYSVPVLTLHNHHINDSRIHGHHRELSLAVSEFSPQTGS